MTTTWRTLAFAPEPKREFAETVLGHWKTDAGEAVLRPIVGWLTQATTDDAGLDTIRVIAAIADKRGRVHPVDCQIDGEQLATITGLDPTYPLRDEVPR